MNQRPSLPDRIRVFGTEHHGKPGVVTAVRPDNQYAVTLADGTNVVLPEAHITVDLSKELSRATACHAAAFFFAKAYDFFKKGTLPNVIEGQGTMSFIRHQGQCLGITNEHVIRKYCTPETVYYPVLALQQHTMLPETPLFRSTQDNQDFPYDIAAFLVNELQVLAAGKTFIESSTFQEIRDDEQGLAVGFPGIERGGITETRMKHPLYHVTAQCISASDRLIILHQELPPPGDRCVKFGGMSGGPLFRVQQDSYSFAGIIFEGRGFADTDDGEPSPDIWVWSFPLSPSLLDHAFRLFKVK